jgi:CubicO group peptidase (beta-lactamase class C family)
MKTPRIIKYLLVFSIVLLWLGSENFSCAQAPWPTTEWPRSTPKKQGINPKLLKELVKDKTKNDQYQYLHSLIIIKDGYLVFEEYFNGFNAEKPNSIQSVTKSFTSAVIGMAMEEGYIKSVDEKVLDFFPDTIKIDNLDEWKKAMTLEDILTMRTGTDYEEGYDDSPHNKLNRLRAGWDNFYLDRPMVRQPGTGFQYDSGGVILLSAMLKNRCGMHVDVYAEKFLFPPLGIERSVWIKNNEGHPHTGGGLNLLPLDMAKFGLLYLRGGVWEDEQLIPAEWVKASFTEHHNFGGPPASKTVGYGYLWWIMRADPDGKGEEPIYAARGYGGQNIFIIPEHDMIVVTTSNWINPAGGGDPPRFLYSHILRALHE